MRVTRTTEFKEKVTFATGITRIKQLYEESLRQPDFEVSENTIKIVLPVLRKT